MTEKPPGTVTNPNPEIRIAVASDLHFEFHLETTLWLPPLPDRCDVLVLAGDIGVGLGAIDAVQRVADRLPNSHIVWVAGNHEFYQGVINFELERFRKTFASHERVHFLEDENVMIHGITFLGCTLWTGFDLLGADRRDSVMAEVEGAINDFSSIGQMDEGAGSAWRSFTPSDARQRYLDSRRWLGDSLKSCEPERTVVVTHFPPLFELSDKRRPLDAMTAYYQADCSDLIDVYQPALWLHGHTHWSAKTSRGRTRIVSNQLGYPGEEGIPPYNTQLTLSLPVNDRD
ncbi:MAG: hypothetical protein EP324_00805 [Gammaproteobacteria bacterium]|nr:MAG: hypothetical protein EP324_00805 [Gammaproteobacteria bacterium]